MKFVSIIGFVLFSWLSTTLFCMSLNNDHESGTDSFCEETLLCDIVDVSDDDDKTTEEDLPSPDELRILFPKVKTGSDLTADETRTILYLYQFKNFPPSDIELIIDRDTSIVCQLIRENGGLKRNFVDNITKEKCYEAYLSSFKSLAAGEITRAQFARGLAAKSEIGFTEDQILNVLKRMNRSRDGQRELTLADLNRITRQYLNGESLFSIVQSYRLKTRADSIVEHLANVLSPAQFRDTLHVSVPKKKRARVNVDKVCFDFKATQTGKKTLKSVVLEIYSTLNDEQKGNPKPFIKAALQARGCIPNRSSIVRILKEAGVKYPRKKSGSSSTTTMSN